MKNKQFWVLAEACYSRLCNPKETLSNEQAQKLIQLRKVFLSLAAKTFTDSEEEYIMNFLPDPKEL